tara:strand:+ start:5523 stop:5687 length:165 start_codon:yes stop_codon:yes gene_type:complete
MNYAIDIAPLAGMLLGVNYWNSTMDDDFEDPTYHSFQICVAVFAIVVTWQTPVK